MSAAVWVAMSLGLLWALTWPWAGVRYARYIKFNFHDAPAALKAGCRVCGAPAVRVTWHRAPRSKWWSLRTVALPWSEDHYQALLRSRHPTSSN
jgi:hypothetical protein